MKFQWSKASAIFGDYEEILKNWEMTVNSAGFTNEQVKVQMDTLARKTKSLKAELDGVFGGIGNAGLGNFLKENTVSLTDFTRGLKESSTTVFTVASEIGKLASVFIILKAAATSYGFTSGVMRANMMLANGATIESIRLDALKVASTSGVVGAVREQAVAQGMLAASTRALTGVGAVGAALTANWPILLAMVAYGIYSVVEAQGAASRALDELNGKSKEENDLLLKQIEVGKQKEQFIGTLAEQYNKLGESITENSGQTAENTKKQEEQQTILEILKRQTGLNTEDLVKNGVIQMDVINNIKKKNKEEAEAKLKENIAKMRAEVDATQQFILNTQARIDGMKSELKAVGVLDKAYQFLHNRMAQGQIQQANELERVANGEDVPGYGIYKAMVPTEEIRKQAQDLRDKAQVNLGQSGQFGIDQLSGQITDANAKVSDLSSRIVSTQGQLNAINNTDGGGNVPPGTLPPAKETNGKLGRAETNDHAEQMQRIRDQSEYRALINSIDLAEKSHTNTLGKLSTQEAIYGNTVGLTMEKQKANRDYIVTLGTEYDSLESLKQKYIEQLDNELSTNSDLNNVVSLAIPNWTSLTKAQQREQAKLNNDLFQSFKTADQLSKLIGEIEGKQGTIRNAADGLRNEETKENKGGTEDVLKQSNRRITGIKDQESIDIANATNKVDPYNDLKLNEIKLKSLRYQQVEHNAQIEFLTSELDKARVKGLPAIIQAKEDELRKEQVIYAQNAEQIKQLEYQKNSKIREGLEGIADDFIVKGNSLKDIWKKLWSDLASEALKQLFRVQNGSSSLLGNILNLFGGSSKGNSKVFTDTPGWQPKNIGNNAEGSIGNQEELSWIREGGKAEAIIPLENNRSRALSLYAETGRRLGVTKGTQVEASVSQKTMDIARQASATLQQAQVQSQHLERLDRQIDLMQQQNNMLLHMINEGGSQGGVLQPLVLNQSMSDSDLYSRIQELKSKGYKI